MNWKDAVEFMIVGASAIQIGTANFINPNVSNEVVDGLYEFCKSQNIKSITELIGSYQIENG
jgi:dihydroorotate dehydrogenase (NAD+) catalytic subunit